MARYSIEFASKYLGRRINFDLMIPTLTFHEALGNKNERYYEEREEKFPLIVFLCGFGENRQSWQRNCDITDLADRNRFACLFVEGENSWYLNRGQISNYEDLVDIELLDFVYGNFKNLDRNLPLIICGQSMGGYGSLQHYLRHTDLYDACIALSPATKADQIDENEFGGSLRDNFLKVKDKKLNIYLSVGEKDFIIGASKELDAWLKENHIGVSYRFIPNADHSWSTWRKEVAKIVNFLKNKGFISSR